MFRPGAAAHRIRGNRPDVRKRCELRAGERSFDLANKIYEERLVVGA